MHWPGAGTVLLAAALGAWGDVAGDGAALHATAVAPFMAAALILSQDLRFAALALVALAFAATLAGWAEATPWGLSGAATGLVLAAVFLAVCVWIARTSGPLLRLDPSGAAVETRRAGRLLAWGVAGAVLLAALAAGAPHEAWRGPIAAAIVSTAIWGLKEFGSDQPNIHLELEEAEAARRDCGAVPAPRRLHDAYLRDAINDTWADTLFCVAGALIGAAVLSPRPILAALDGGAVWAQGAVILGLLVFAAAFLVVGREWAMRQQALDLCGCQRANRLAVFTSRIRLWVRGAEVSDPLDALDALARAAPARGGPAGAAPFRHLLVFGGPGAGKGPLGEALASEAALRDIDSAVSSPWRTLGLDGGPPPPRPKTSRVISAEALVSIAERLSDGLRRLSAPGRGVDAIDARGPGAAPLIAYRLGDVRYNPTAELFVCPEDRGSALPKPRWRVTRDRVHAGEPDFHAADLVVVSDVRDRHDLGPIGQALLPQGKQTVWLCEGVSAEELGEGEGAGGDGPFLRRRASIAEGLGLDPADIAVAVVSRRP